MPLSHASGARDVPLLDETIGANLRQTVDLHPEREALVVPHQGYRATYAELWSEVDRAARALIAHGVRTGDRVTSPWLPVSMLGSTWSMRAGALERPRSGRREPGEHLLDELDRPPCIVRLARLRACRRSTAGR